MAERPIRAAVQALTSLRAAAGAQFELLRAATVGRAEGAVRAAAVADARLAAAVHARLAAEAGPRAAGPSPSPGSSPGLSPGLCPGPSPAAPGAAVAERAKPIAAVVDGAASATLRALDAEVALLVALLRDTPQPGRRPPFAAPSASAAGDPTPAASVPRRAPEPELTDGVRYAAHPLTFPAGVGTTFARQGSISDCHLVAALCAVADRAPWLLPAVTASHDTVVVDVPRRRYRLRPTLPVDAGSGRLAYACSPDGSTLVPFVEKAFAVYGGGYPVLARGGLPVEALYWLTGRPSYLLRVPKADDDIVAALVESGQPAVACSRPFDDDGSGAAAALRYRLAPVAHAYAVRGLDADRRVLLHNPWGRRHPRPVPLDVFRDLFTRIDWCETDDG
ncbi:calpain family cysteine peptidase [Jiangella endophytica]|uniref:C2 family cysteine protease n=1 Tax=Jiangella endophytica TaxID=1623398 RepID=UPI000E344A64|nr:C2 family cysteine protease [Jiangella endophytica]